MGQEIDLKDTLYTMFRPYTLQDILSWAQGLPDDWTNANLLIWGDCCPLSEFAKDHGFLIPRTNYTVICENSGSNTYALPHGLRPFVEWVDQFLSKSYTKQQLLVCIQNYLNTSPERHNVHAT